MNVRTRGYEGLLEHQEVFESLCGAVLLQAVRDRATLQQRGNLKRHGCSADIRALDKWFESRTCNEMCNVIGVSIDFSGVDWDKVSVPHLKRGYCRGT